MRGMQGHAPQSPPGSTATAPRYSAVMGAEAASHPVLPTREEVFARVARVADETGADEARVFGSWARGTQTRHSDVDVLITERSTEPFLQRLDRYLLPLTRAVDGPVIEVLVYTPQELEDMRDRPFVRRALDESVLVFRREPAEAVEN